MTPTTIAARSDRIQRTLEHLRQHTTDTTDQLVPFGPGQYTDPGLAQRERDLVFGRVPSIVAHASELPEPNDFITLQMPRNRVIVARQHDGSVKCFVNVCRHRGALLEELQSGRCRHFSCGYHRGDRVTPAYGHVGQRKLIAGGRGVPEALARGAPALLAHCRDW